MEDLEDAANGDDQPAAAAGNDLPKFDNHQDHQSRKRLQFEDDEGEDHDFLDD